MSAIHAIEEHPDILALRAGYERAAETVAGQATLGLTMLTAVYAALSPWIVGFDATTRLTVNNLIVGLTVAVLAFGLGTALDRAHTVSWTLPLFGVWQIICLWILRDVNPTAGMIWSNVVSGGLIIVFGFAAAALGRARAGTAR
ncbi:MAG TPA: SPW repeat protein [Propionibacteriaceae bacterium]|nr:SPW repeat protein [Propionibacteriaceae bacterium]